MEQQCKAILLAVFNLFMVVALKKKYENPSKMCVISWSQQDGYGYIIEQFLKCVSILNCVAMALSSYNSLSFSLPLMFQFQSIAYDNLQSQSDSRVILSLVFIMTYCHRTRFKYIGNGMFSTKNNILKLHWLQNHHYYYYYISFTRNVSYQLIFLHGTSVCTYLFLDFNVFSLLC